LWYMEGRLSVLSVQRSAVTAVPFVVYGRQAYCSDCTTQCCHCSTISPLAVLHNLQQKNCAREYV